MILKYRLFENTEETDLVICRINADGIGSRNHVGYLRKNGIEFLIRFNNRLHDLNGEIDSQYGWMIDPKNTIPFNDNRGQKTMSLVYSADFKKMLERGLTFLLGYESIYHTDVSYIKPGLKNDQVSCLSLTNYNKLLNKRDVWETKMRQNINIGRFLRKILPFENEKIIEDYVNEYKFIYNLLKTDIGTFRKISGEEMRKWYLEKNYAIGGGNLNQSCMRHLKSQKRLAIYTQNPNKVKMLAIINYENQLLGRALLWKLDEPSNAFYMDRVYITEDQYKKYFDDYAKRMKFLTREYVDKNDITLKVFLDRDFGPPSQNPFMDTFKIFNKNGKFLTNKFKNLKPNEYYEYIDHD